MKSVTIIEHKDFEDAIVKAFPIYPQPRIEWEITSAFEYAAKELLMGKTWPEVIGWRLRYGELDPCLSIWISTLPLEVAHYFLPSHLMLSSILLKIAPLTLTYPYNVMEALILPNGDSQETLEEIDDELHLEATVTYYGESRRNLYRVMSEEQRSCVASYLDIFFEYHKVEFSGRSIELYKNNSETWRNSSLLK